MVTARKDLLAHASHHTALCLAPGLFRPLYNGEQKTGKLDVTYRTARGGVIEFSGPEPLGAYDLRLLQVLVALAGAEGAPLPMNPETRTGTRLREGLELTEGEVYKTAWAVRCSYHRISLELGVRPGSSSTTKRIRESLERLWKVSIIVDQGGQRRGYRMLNSLETSEKKGRLSVALNPRIAAAIAGEKGQGRTFINLDEARALKSPGAAVLHQFLCGWAKAGRFNRVGCDKLLSHIWPGPKNPAAKRQQKKRLGDVLVEIAALEGWSITDEGRGMYLIRRARQKYNNPS